MKSLLSLGVKEDRLVVVEDFSIDSGKTKDLDLIIKNFVKDASRTILILKHAGSQIFQTGIIGYLLTGVTHRTTKSLVPLK